MTVPFIDMKAALAASRQGLDEAYHRVLDSAYLVLGAELEAFEDEFAAYCGARHCIGVGNGLDALTLSLHARGIGRGDEIIVPAQTFIATWLAASMVGATLVPAEVDDRTANLDPDAVLAAVTPRTRAIMPVHLFGQPADMLRLRDIASRHDLFVLEDAAQAQGGLVAGQRTGTLGDAAGFSFYPTKNLGCIGDGGAVVTNDENLAAKIRRLRNYGSSKKYVHEVVAGNTRLDELQAAFLRVKLQSLDSDNMKRRALAARYRERLLGTSDIALPGVLPGCEHVYHLFVVRTRERGRLQTELTAKGIQTQIHYPLPPHLQPAYSDMGLTSGAFPIAEAWADQCLSLPLWPQMSFDQVDEVAEGVIAAFN